MKNLRQRFWQAGATLAVALVAVVGVVRADGEVLANLVVPPSKEDTTTLESRLAARKTAYKSMLPAAANAAIADKCSLSQSAIADVKTKDIKAAAIRFDAYNGLAKQLSYLVDNLSSQGVDASSLLDAQNKFVGAINQYLVDASDYRTAIDDAVTVDCKADPAGFKASLLDARSLRSKLASDVAAVKSSSNIVRSALSKERQILIKNPGHAPTGKVGTKG